MTDPVENAPMVTVDKTQMGDNFIWRAISKRDNVMFICGRDTLDNARRAAHEQLRRGWLVEDPIRKEDRRWKV